eukprot:1158776-Pelagomonas_calceolata.AAC.1
MQERKLPIAAAASAAAAAATALSELLLLVSSRSPPLVLFRAGRCAQVQLPFSEFVQRVKQNEVSSVSIDGECCARGAAVTYL